MKRLIGGDAQIRPLDAGLEGCSASGDQDLFGLERVARRELDRMWPFDRGPVVKHLHSGAIEQGLVDVFETADFLVLVGNKRGPVKAGIYRPAKAGGDVSKLII